MQGTEKMNKSQLRKAVQELIDKLKNMTALREKNCQLERDIEALKTNETNSKILMQENSKFRRALKNRQDLLKTLKENKEDFLKQEEHLKKIIIEKDKQYKQLKRECDPLRKTISNLEDALSHQEKEQGAKIQALMLEVEKSQKKIDKLREKNTSLQETNKTFQDNQTKAQKQMNHLENDLNKQQMENDSLINKLSETCTKQLFQKQNMRTLEIEYFDLKKQLERSKKKAYVKYPYESRCKRQEPPRHERKLDDRELQSKLTAKCIEVEKKGLMVKNRETQIEQLKKDMSRMVPSEKLELIPRYKRTIREQDDTIKVLMAEAEMYKSKHDEYSSERETLIDRVVDIKKSYLKEKMQHRELCATKVDGIPLPRFLQEQSKGHKLDTTRKTLKTFCPHLAPISNQAQNGDKSSHIVLPTI